MKNQTSHQIFLDFNREFANVTVTGDMLTVNLPSQESLELAKEKGIPFINLCPPRVRPSDFFTVLNKVAEIIWKYKPELKDEISGYLAALPGEIEAQELFVSQVFTPGVNLTEKIEGNIAPETMTFLLSHAVKPFMKEYGRIMSSYYDPEGWLKSICPVCGGKPTFSLLNKDAGGRYLFCGLCEVKWRFQRLGCPYCGNYESKFFTVEGMEKYRVYFCDKCHGYIKTIDERKLDENYLAHNTLDLFWEDINTVQLDLLAMQEGYSNQRVDDAAKDTVK